MLKSIVVFLVVLIAGYFLWTVGRSTLPKNTPLKIAFSRRSYWENQVSGLEAEIEITEALLEAETLEMNELKAAYDNAKGKEKASIKSKMDSLEVLLNHYRDNLRKLEIELRRARDELLNL